MNKVWGIELSDGAPTSIYSSGFNHQRGREKNRSHGAGEIAQQGKAVAQFPAPTSEGWQLRPETPAPVDLMPLSGLFGTMTLS